MSDTYAMRSLIALVSHCFKFIDCVSTLLLLILNIDLLKHFEHLLRVLTTTKITKLDFHYYQHFSAFTILGISTMIHSS